MNYLLEKSVSSAEYELLDSGEGMKLERYGSVVLSRPDPQAVWMKRLAAEEWKNAHATFTHTSERGQWIKQKDIPEEWDIEYGGLRFMVKPTPFKHTGLFPEQAANWKWIKDVISKRKDADKKVSVLNLFGYTGGATLAAAQAGAEVTHIDASKTAIGWARQNAELTGLKDAPIRWLLDDAAAFVLREARRGKKYDGIMMDPPAFGRGPKGEVWKIEDELLRFLQSIKNILSDEPLFVLLNGYASGYSAVSYKNIIEGLMSDFKKESVIEAGELVIEESSQKDLPQRLLPAGIFSRWCADE